MVTIQFALIFITYYSETRMARESARWLAIRATTTTDAAFAQHVQQTMLPGLNGGTPTRQAPDASNPSDAYHKVGNMSVWFTPCMSSATAEIPPTAGVCQHTDRAPGKTMHVEMQYDISNLLFLPTNFRFGTLQVKIPTGLPRYRVSLMVE
jgi:hypothetical protein